MIYSIISNAEKLRNSRQQHLEYTGKYIRYWNVEIPISQPNHQFLRKLDDTFIHTQDY